MSWIFRPLIHFLKFGLLHLLIMPWMLMIFNANRLFPKVDKVIASELNVRADSSTSAPSFGHLQKGQHVDIINYGDEWHQISRNQKFVITSSEEEIKQYTGSPLFISSAFVKTTYRDLTNDYVGYIAMLHIICYILLLIVFRNRFFEILWNQMFATDTIPLGIKTGYYLLVGLFKKKEPLIPE